MNNQRSAYSECPNCAKDLTLDEIRAQKCDDCNYPYHNETKADAGEYVFDPDALFSDDDKEVSHG